MSFQSNHNKRQKNQFISKLSNNVISIYTFFTPMTLFNYPIALRYQIKFET